MEHWTGKGKYCYVENLRFSDVFGDCRKNTSAWSGLIIQKQPPEVLYKKGVLEVWNFIKREALAQVFSFEFCEIFMNTFLTEYLRTTASGYYLAY